MGGANASRRNAECRRQFSRCQRQECPRRHTRWLAPVSSSHQLYAGLPALEKIFHLPRGVENGTKRMKIETQSTRIYLQRGNFSYLRVISVAECPHSLHLDCFSWILFSDYKIVMECSGMVHALRFDYSFKICFD